MRRSDPYQARARELASAAGLDPDAPDTRDDRFEFGLGCLLDGIAARLTYSS